MIAPAAAPVPALKWQLLPPLMERKPGNAAPTYAQAALHYNPTEADTKAVDELLKASPAQFERLAKDKNAERYLNDGAWKLLRIAACRDRCEWELPLHEGDMFSMLLPEMGEMRELSRLVALRARLHVAKKEYPEAIGALQVGYAMARHSGASPTLLHGIVADSIVRRMDPIVLELAQQAGSPNLYWALTFQPRPLVDFRCGLEGEMHQLELSIPRFREAATKEPDAANWDEVVKGWIGFIQHVQGLATGDQALVGKDLSSHLLRLVYVEGRVFVNRKRVVEELVGYGIPRSRVERMGSAQLFLAHGALKYDELRDDMFRWTMVPYAEGREGLKAAGDRLKKSAQDREELFPWGALMLPAVLSVRTSHARTERNCEVLRLIEALRLYAAEHDGKLPKTLDTLRKATPIAHDGMSGSPFDYLLDGKMARLTLRDERNDGRPVVYEITVAGKE